MIDLIVFVLFAPIVLIWVVLKLLEDMGRFFGFWLLPATLSIYFGILLFVIGPPVPNAVFSSIFEWLSGYVIVGLRLPLLLLFAGVAMLVAGASLRHSRRAWKRAGS